MAQYELTLIDYWRILRKRPWLVVGGLVASLLLTGLYLRRQLPNYRAVAKIKLQKIEAVPFNAFNVLQAFENPIVTESRVIESRLIAEEVARRLTKGKPSLDPSTFQGLVDVVQGSIKAESLPDTNIIQIAVKGSNADWATSVANFTAEAYIDTNLLEKNREARKVREFIENQLAQTESRLRQIEDRVKQIRQEGTATGLAVTIDTRMADIQTKLSELLLRVTEAHPDVIRLREQQKDLAAQLKELPAEELEFSRLNRDREVTEKTYRTLRERLEEARLAEAQKTPDAAIIERATIPKNPTHPVKQLGLAIGGLLGILLGCVIAFVMETMDTSLGTIEDVENFLQVPVLAVIPHLTKEEQAGSGAPQDRLRIWKRMRRVKPDDDALDLYTHYSPHTTAAEAYRILRTNLKLSSDKKLLLITSATPAEGKSTVICNLGVVIAQGGSRILLVSGDLRKPRLTKSFGLSKEAGLTETLRGELPFERTIRGLSDFILGKFGYDEVVKNPYLANLFIVPAGTLPDNPVELIGSQNTRELLQQLRAKFDVVLVDGPPLLPVADSLLLAPHVDGVVLIYEAGRTSRAAVLRAKALLDSVGAKLIGVVLNHVRPEVQTYPYYYYYRQRYAYHSEKEAKSTSPVSARS